MRRNRPALLLLALIPLTLALPVVSRAAPRRAELEAAEERLHELERDFEIVVERYNLVTERLEDIEVEIAETRLDVDRIERRMSARQEAADAAATELYMGGGVSHLEAVLGAASLNDADTRLFYLQESEDSQLKVFESLEIAGAELDARIADLEDARARARASEDRLAALQAAIETKLAEQQDEIAELNERIETAQRRREEREEAERRAALRAALRAAREAARASAAEPSAEPNASPRDTAPVVDDNAAGAVAVRAALSQLGKPYVWGAEGPDGFDCSGLTLWAWGKAGVSLPHNSGMQYATTARVDRSNWQLGDLLFFGSPIHHVGMYIGNGQMVEAPYTGSVVRINSAVRSDYVGAGRPGV